MFNGLRGEQYKERIRYLKGSLGQPL